MAAGAQGQTRIVFAVGDTIVWSRETVRTISSLPTGFLAEIVRKASSGPFTVEAIKLAITVCRDKDFEHPQILQIKDSAGKTSPDELFSGIFFEKVEVEKRLEIERTAA